MTVSLVVGRLMVIMVATLASGTLSVVAQLYLCPERSALPESCSCTPGSWDHKGVHVECRETPLGEVANCLSTIRTPIHSLALLNCTAFDDDLKSQPTFTTPTSGGGQSSPKWGSACLFHGKAIYELSILYTSGLEGATPLADDVFDPLYNVTQSLTLRGNGLTSLPVSLLAPFKNLTRLDLSHNSIRTLPAHAFKTLTNLTFIDISHNLLNKIDSNAFMGLSNLDQLNLNHNQLQKWERNVFKPVARKLRHLDFSQNQFKEFGRNDFIDLLGLQVLNCSHNMIASVPRSALARNSQLMSLSIAGNQLQEVDSFLFKGTRFLRHFNASHNQIKSIARHAFKSTTRIKSIDLSHNQLSEVGTDIFTQLQYCDLVNLSHNMIESITSGAFVRMYLVAIDLSHNRISKISSGSFQELANVTHLDFSHNEIESIPQSAFSEDCDVTQLDLSLNRIVNISRIAVIGNFTGLKVLNMSHNQIQGLDRKSFTSKRLYELHTIDLEYNKIRTLTGNVFEKFASIRLIKLRNNSLEKIGFGSFGTLHTLLELDVSHNEIQDVSGGGLSQLVSVRIIRANNNHIRKMFPIPVALNELHLEDNMIDEIRPGLFSTFNSLLHLYLDRNRIQKLEAGSFANLLQLRSLSLSGNQLQEVPWEALQGLQSLQSLSLDGNQIKELKRRAFGGSLPVVADLRLDRNEISMVEPYAFEGMVQLVSLNLSSNRIGYGETRETSGSMKPEVFRGLVALKTLDLSHNELTQIDNKTHSLLDDLLSLEEIDLRRNRISYIRAGTFPTSPYIPYQIKRIDLTGNSIPMLGTHFAAGMKKVEWLSLADNMIDEIRPGVFINLTNVKILDMSGNKLSKVPKGVLETGSGKEGSLRRLESLSLARNRLGSLYPQDVASLPALKELDLSDNRFTTVYSELVSIMVKRNIRVHLRGNPFICDCANLKQFVTWVNIALDDRKRFAPTFEPLFRNLTCGAPHPLQGTLLHDLRDDPRWGCSQDGNRMKMRMSNNQAAAGASSISFMIAIGSHNLAMNSFSFFCPPLVILIPVMMTIMSSLLQYAATPFFLVNS